METVSQVRVLPKIEVVEPEELVAVELVADEDEDDPLPEELVRIVVEVELPVLDWVVCVPEEVLCAVLEVVTVMEEVDCEVWESAKYPPAAIITITITTATMIIALLTACLIFPDLEYTFQNALGSNNNHFHRFLFRTIFFVFLLMPDLPLYFLRNSRKNFEITTC